MSKHARLLLMLSAIALMRGTLAAGIEVTVLTIEGEERKETLVESDAGLRFEGATALKDVAEITLAPRSAPPQGHVLYLRNGDVLYNVKIISGDDTKVKVTSDAAGALTLDNQFIHAFTFLGKEWPASDVVDVFLKGPKSKEDLLLQPKGDTTPGYLEKFSDKDFSFNAGGQSRTFMFENTAALRLAPLEELKPVAGQVATVELRDGSRISGKILGLTTKALRVEAISGQEWPVAIDGVSGIEFKGGKMVHMSDLTPRAVDERPYIGGVPLIYKWRKDKAASGGKLATAAKDYERGIGVHSYSKLTYELSGNYAKFLCDAGLDVTAQSGAVSNWKVLIDGKAAAEGVAKSGEKAQAVSIDVKGAKQLELICDFGPDETDSGDLLNWAGARLIKP